MMKWISIGMIFLSMPILAEQFVYLSSKGDKKIEVYQLLENGDLIFKQSAISKAAPGNSVMAPNKKFLYVSVKDKKNCGIETFQINDDGTLASIAYATTPYSCGFLAIDSQTKYLFASHYSDGRVTTYKLEKYIFRGQLLDDIKTDERAHSIGIDKTGSYVYAPHTAPNKIYQFTFKDERLAFLSPKASMGPHTDTQYHEPRHFVFHPFKNLLYSSNEKGSGISLWSQSPTGQLTLQQTVLTLPEKSDRRFSASDITMSAGARFIYIAERDYSDESIQSRKDCIVAYQLDPKSGALKSRIGSFSVGRIPRCLGIDKENKFVLCTAVNSGTLSIFKINNNTGYLSPLKTYNVAAKPMWISFLKK